MEPDAPDTTEPAASPAQHLATVGHEGRFWDVFMEFEEDPAQPRTCRARFRFNPSDLNQGEIPVHTATIIIEPSYEDAMRKARSFTDHQFVALLRSALPDST